MKMKKNLLITMIISCVAVYVFMILSAVTGDFDKGPEGSIFLTIACVFSVLAGTTMLWLFGILIKSAISKVKGKRKNFKSSNIVIKGKKSKVIINIEESFIKYKKIVVKLEDILEIELLDKSKVVEKSGMQEAVIGGILFGSIGAVAGAYAGKGTKEIESYKIVLKTSDIFNSIVFIPASYENCVKIANTLFMLLRRSNTSINNSDNI